jgi:hypothetical protein
MRSIESIKTTKPFDILGISSATLCMIHCMAFPLFTLIPFGLTDDGLVDIVFAAIGLIVVLRILMSTAEAKVKKILGASVLLVAVSVVLEVGFECSTGLLYVGGVGMIYGHFLNFKLQKHRCN